MDNPGILQIRDNFSRLLWMVPPDGDYDSHHPSKSHKLATSLLRYITKKSQVKRRSESFVKEIRNKLHRLHQYNMSVEKLKNKYPTSKQLSALIVKYVELEFDVLYFGRTVVSHKAETQTLQKVLKFLQIIAHKSQENADVTSGTEAGLDFTRSILAILADVKSDCFEDGKFVNTLTKYLLGRFGAQTCTNIPLYDYLKRHFASKNQNDKTSDYESAESDPEHSNQGAVTTTPSIPSRVTIELNDDDDDTYMVYLENAQKTLKRTSSSRQSEVVLLSSDSENESEEPERSNNKRKTGVVTFEILDDDNEDNCNNVMIYMGNEINAKKARKKAKTVDQSEPIALSDSDDEDDNKTQEKTVQNIKHEILDSVEIKERNIEDTVECEEIDIMNEKLQEVEEKIEINKEEVCDSTQGQVLSELAGDAVLKDDNKSNESSDELTSAEDFSVQMKSPKTAIIDANSDIFDVSRIFEQLPITSIPSDSPRSTPSYTFGNTSSTITTFYNMTSFSAVFSSPQGFPNGFNAEALASYLLSHNFFENSLNLEEAFQTQSTLVKSPEDLDQVLLENSNSLEFPDQKCLLNFDRSQNNINELVDPSLILKQLPLKKDNGAGIDDSLLVNLLNNTPNPDVLEKYVFGNEMDESMEQLILGHQNSDFKNCSAHAQKNTHT